VPTYAQNVVSELDGVAAAYADILAASDIENVDPNRWADGTGIGFVGFRRMGLDRQ
jgi:hypothetical protein